MLAEVERGSRQDGLCNDALTQHEVGGEIVGSPALEQGGNGRTELAEEITQLKALLRVERNLGHAAGVYGGTARTTARYIRSLIAG